MSLPMIRERLFAEGVFREKIPAARHMLLKAGILTETGTTFPDQSYQAALTIDRTKFTRLMRRKSE